MVISTERCFTFLCSQAQLGGNVDGRQRPLSASTVPRQRVPFDWTVGDNVTSQDKTLQQRVEEMRQDYVVLAASKEASAMAVLPPGGRRASVPGVKGCTNSMPETMMQSTAYCLVM